MNWLAQFASSKVGILVLSLVVLLFLERGFPAVNLRTFTQRIFKNFSLAGLNVILSPFIVVPVTLFAAQWQMVWRPDWASGVLIDLLFLDCWIYFWHRANHAIPFLWRFHEVHHLDESLDVSSALRFHFGEVVLSSLVRVIVIILLGIPLSTVVIFEALVTLAAMFHHSNIRIPQRLEKLLAVLIVTPSIHFLHHHALREDTIQIMQRGFQFGTAFLTVGVSILERLTCQWGLRGRAMCRFPALFCALFGANEAH